jgi:hypothetical protein
MFQNFMLVVISIHLLLIGLHLDRIADHLVQ